MDKHRAIPQGYMTVGTLAKKMNTTVRTLQYYDKEGLLSPSAESEGGRRLYTDKDIIRLHQTQSMKYLGFSLDDMKNRLISLDSPEDVAVMLTEQATAVREKIANLSESLKAIEVLHEQVLQMKSVDWTKYADIIVSLKLKNEYYWMIKHIDDDTLDALRKRFNTNSASDMIDSLNHLLDKAVQFQKSGVKPESDEGFELAKGFWDKMIEFADGDLSLLPKFNDFFRKSANTENSELRLKQETAMQYIESALMSYFTKLGVNPFEGKGGVN